MDILLKVLIYMQKRSTNEEIGQNNIYFNKVNSLVNELFKKFCFTFLILIRLDY